jgi:hypothetical protein
MIERPMVLLVFAMRLRRLAGEIGAQEIDPNRGIERVHAG